MTAHAQLRIRSLGPETAEDFHALLGAAPYGWCWCVAWEVPTWEGWGERRAEENRALRAGLEARGHYHGYLLYEDGEPLAWSRVGPRRAWPKLCAQFGLDPAEEMHAFTCFGVRADRRGGGLLHPFLEMILEDLRARGVKTVEAFPRAEPGPLDPEEAWNGPRKIFTTKGFRTEQASPPRVRMVLDL